MSKLLALSITAESLPICKHLVSWGADLEIPAPFLDIYYPKGHRALARAAKLGNSVLVQFFLESGAEIDSPISGRVRDSHTPLCIRGRGREEAVLSEAEKEQCQQFDNALTLASRAGNLAVVVLLLEYGATIDTFYDCRCYYSALCSAIASRNFNVELIQLLFDACLENDDPWRQTRWDMALAEAAAKGNLVLMEKFLESGAIANAELHFNGQYRSPLVAAVIHGQEGAVRLMIEEGADANTLLTTGWFGSALIAASFEGKESMVQLLIEEGAEVNAAARCGDFRSALIAAPWRSSESIVRLLIEKGAEANAIATSGDFGSALIAAATRYEFSPSTMDLLMNRGVEVNLSVEVGRYCSALAAAVLNGNQRAVEGLLKAGVDVNMSLHYGSYRNALHAARNTRFEGRRVREEVREAIIDTLLKAGAVDDELLWSLECGSIEPRIIGELQET